MENALIRPTNADDLKIIMEMIKEIADFVNMRDSLKITENDLRRDGNFDGCDHSYFYSFVAEMDIGIVGYSFSHFTYSSHKGKGLFLEEIYVKEPYRQLGIGKKLFLENVKFALAENCKRLDFHVLKWNQNAKKFYEKLHAENITERDGWELFRLDQPQMAILKTKSE